MLNGECDTSISHLLIKTAGFTSHVALASSVFFVNYRYFLSAQYDLNRDASLHSSMEMLMVSGTPDSFLHANEIVDDQMKRSSRQSEHLINLKAKVQCLLTAAFVTLWGRSTWSLPVGMPDLARIHQPPCSNIRGHPPVEKRGNRQYTRLAPRLGTKSISERSKRNRRWRNEQSVKNMEQERRQ
jgi:hypothetical protein